jgi:hypothetical protein
MRRHAPWLIVTLMLALGPGSAMATTIVPAADPGELARDSHAVFMARAGANKVLTRSDYIVTATELEVVSVIKGQLTPGEVIESVVPGGEKDGVGWAVSGTPKLEEGQVYLFFADRNPRGRWQPRLMADSVLRREAAKDGRVILVALDEASHLNRVSDFDKSGGLIPGPVYEDEFLLALKQSLQGKFGWVWEPLMAWDEHSPTTKAVPGECAFMSGGGRNIRWNSGPTVTIRATQNGDPSISGGGFSQVSGAVSAWNNEPDPTSFNLTYGSPSSFTFSSCNSGEQNDYPPSGQNVVVFDDPCDDIGDLSGCSGTLGFGGPWYGGSHTHDGTLWNTASSLFVVLNNGVGCLGSTGYTRLVTHEMGHGFGFDHVSDSNANMYAWCCNPINSTDATCAQYAYPVAGPTNTPTPVTPTNTPTPTITPGGPTNTPTRTPTSTPGGPTATPTPTSGGPTNTPTNTPTRTPTQQASTPTPSIVTVPVIVHLPGSGGTSWRSDVTLGNRNSSSQTVRLHYQSAAKASFQVTRTIVGYGTLLLEDLVEKLFAAGDGRGPLEIEILHGGKQPPVVASRAYSENSFGNLGSGLPADIVPSTQVVSMPGLFHDSNFRASIAVTADDQDVWATFELYRGPSGLVAGGVKRKIDAGEQKQWFVDKLFGSLAQQGVPMTVRVSLNKPGIAYASLVDNDSTDSAVYLGKEPANTWIVPAVAHLPGSGGTFWSSSVAMWNATGNTAWVTLEYLPEKTNNSGGGMFSTQIKLNPYQSRNIGDVLADYFSIDNGKGTLVVDSTRPITVTSRVFTDCASCPDGGTSGNGVRTAPVAALRSGDTLLPGVRMLNGFRTNIGVVTGDKHVKFEFDLRSEGGSLRSSASKTVAPRTLQQWSMKQLFGSGFNEPDPAGSIIISGNQPYLSYLTIIDGSSQDPVFVMPQ